MLKHKLAYVAIVVALTASRAAVAAMMPSQIIVFGDSLSDTGNAYATSKVKVTVDGNVAYDDLAAFPGPTPPDKLISGVNDQISASLTGLPNWTNQQIADRITAVDNSIKQSYNYTAGRFTDGKDDTKPKSSIAGVWVEQLADLLKLALPKPSTKGGNNYAWGGAETGKGPVPAPLPKSRNFSFQPPRKITIAGSVNGSNISDQVKTYADSLKGKKADGTALYTIWGGGNDLINIADSLLKKPDMAGMIVDAVAPAVKNLTDAITAAYTVGARCFVWPDLPPMERLPEYKDADPKILTALKDASVKFKTEEDKAIKDLQTNNAGLMIAEVDTLGLFNDVLKNPTDDKYKFDNIDTPAMGKNVNPDKYVFWDTIHPTTRTDQLIANAAYSAALAAGCIVPEPRSVTLLGAAIFYGLICARSSRGR
jgi:phospholipase/lecithinase/hemolysin